MDQTLATPSYRCRKRVVGLPVCEARPAHHHVLQQAEVRHLVLAASGIEQHRGLHLVGLHAAHIVRLLEDRAEGCWPKGLNTDQEFYYLYRFYYCIVVDLMLFYLCHFIPLSSFIFSCVRRCGSKQTKLSL